MDSEHMTFIKQFLSGPHAEALQWLREGGNRRTLGEHATTAQSIALIERLYALGAEKVLAVDLQDDQDGGGASRYLLVELPEEERRRQWLFDFEREQAELRGFDGERDEGQLCLFFDVKGIE